MSTSYICSACRRHLSRVRPGPIVQLQTRAGFISLSWQTTRNAPAADPVGDDTLRWSGDVQETAAMRNKKTIALKGAKTPASQDAGDLLEALFEESLKSPPRARPPSQPSTILEPYTKVDTLRKMLGQGGNAADSWFYFVEHFGPDAGNTAYEKKSSPTYLISVVRELIKEIIQEKKRSPLSPSLPSVAEVSKICSQLGLLLGTEWSTLIIDLIASILEIRQQVNPRQEDDDRLTLDLLKSWNIICRDVDRQGTLPDIDSTLLNWTSLPDVRDASLVSTTRGIQMAFGLLVPLFEARHLQDIPCAASATFGLLTQSKLKSVPILNAYPFTRRLAHIIAIQGLKDSDMITGSNSLIAPVVREYVQSSWDRLKASALGSRSTLRDSVSTEDLRSPETSALATRNRVSWFDRQLEDALKNGHLRRLEELWGMVKKWPIVKPKPGTKHREGRIRGQLTPDICSDLIRCFMSLRQPNRAIEIWNHMADNGIPPSLATWNAFLVGCKKTSDWRGSETIWSRMLKSNVQPDSFCWTTRILVLIQCSEIAAGIKALDEMGRIWLTAARQKYPSYSLGQIVELSDVNDVAKPTIVTINGVLGALLRQQEPEAAKKVLAWGGRLGIKPDNTTFNTLLVPLARAGNFEGMAKILSQMDQSGIQADVATFTIILNESFSFKNKYTEEQQRAIIDNVFGAMETAGIVPDIFTYGKIIYGTLRNQDEYDVLPIINIILERMLRQDLKMSPMISTMILEHYFKRRPLDLRAIEGWIQYASEDPSCTDYRFWDRVVEGYSKIGDTAEAVRIYRYMTSIGCTLGWGTWSEMTLALVSNGERELAQSLVAKLALETGGPSPECVPKARQFWELTEELGILET